jgi:predicted HTH domain antitoxin
VLEAAAKSGYNFLCISRYYSIAGLLSMVMKIELPDDIMQSSGIIEADCLIELSARLYADQRISLAQALRLFGLDRFEFEQQLARRDISLYTIADLHEDVETLKALGRW